MSATYTEWLLITHLITTAFMTVVTWFVQIVHYPMLARLGREEFVQRQQLHMKQTGWVVGPTLILEAGSIVGYFIFSPASATGILLWSIMTLLAMFWLSTIVWQAPIHQKLSKGYNELLLLRLIRTNWIRTSANTTRIVLVALLFMNR